MKMIEITEREYDDLVEDSMMLEALDGAGVDNWEGYDEAMSILSMIKAESKRLDQIKEVK